MLLAVADGAVYLERRPPSGIWGGLWSFPEIDDADDWVTRIGGEPGEREQWGTLRHSFSHYDLDILPLVLMLDAVPEQARDTGDALWYRLDDSPPGGLAAPVSRLIDTLRNTHHVANR